MILLADRHGLRASEVAGLRLSNLDLSTGTIYCRCAHSVQIFNDALAEVARRYLHKGSRVYLEGQLENRSFDDKKGVQRMVTEVVLHPYRGELTLLDKAPEADNREVGRKKLAEIKPKLAKAAAKMQPTNGQAARYTVDAELLTDRAKHQMANKSRTTTFGKTHGWRSRAGLRILFPVRFNRSTDI